MTLHDIFFKKKVSRSRGGDIVMMLSLALIASVMVLPMVYAIAQSFKPSNELFIFPPRFFVRNPTLDNYINLFSLISSSWVPFSRYLFNTILITTAGTVGHILIASMCAYAVALYRLPGANAFFVMVRTSLMYTGATAIPSFIIIVYLGLLDNYLALILPALCSPLGFFLMKQFMEQSVPKAMLESADMDGANEFRKFLSIVMPMVKPAWLTLMIFTIQGLWNIGSTPYLLSEQLKTMPYALSQISAGGIARVGVGCAISVVMMLVPLSVFILSQSNIIETMTASGIKE